jgi:hypothetical protein
MILIPFYRFLVLGKASPIFSCKKELVVEVMFSLFHEDVSIGPGAPI